MNIVNSGTQYQIFDKSINTFESLPAKCFKIKFNPMQGFYLEDHELLNITEEKIYGDVEYNANKILKSFDISNRNLGVILSGVKGSGKSLFAKVLAKKANEQGMPLILSDFSHKGLSDFISSIKQECIVLFDEFEKNFPSCDEDDDTDIENSQEGLLGLFDGIDSGKKIFVITCNEVGQLSEYLLNRPGRFHYHFNISTPNQDDIKNYLIDKLKPEYHGVIEKIAQLSYYGDITYDCLRAIAFEINQGYDLQEVISCLNISRNNEIYLDIEVTLSDGSVFESRDSLNVKYQFFTYLHMQTYANEDEIKISFNPKDLIFSEDGIDIDINNVKLYNCDYNSSGKLTIKKINIKRNYGYNYVNRYIL